MRTLILSVAVVACLVLADARGFGPGGLGFGPGGHGFGFGGHGFGHGGRGPHGFGSHSGSHEKAPGKFVDPILQAVNATVQLIISSKTDDGLALWDLLPSLLRFVILNQAQLQSDSWNVTDLVINKKSNLTWSELPENIKTVLLEEKRSNAFPSLTFAQLNLVSGPNDPLATVTIQQVLPKKVAGLMQNITELLKDISFDTKVNITALRDALWRKAPLGLSFLGGFHKSQTRVCLWNLLLSGDSNLNSFSDLMTTIISNANLKQIWQAQLINRLVSHRNRLGSINDICYLFSLGKFLMRTF